MDDIDQIGKHLYIKHIEILKGQKKHAKKQHSSTCQRQEEHMRWAVDRPSVVRPSLVSNLQNQLLLTNQDWDFDETSQE